MNGEQAQVMPPSPALFQTPKLLAQASLNELLAVSGNARQDCERLRQAMGDCTVQAEVRFLLFYEVFARVNWLHNALMALKVSTREEKARTPAVAGTPPRPSSEEVA